MIIGRVCCYICELTQTGMNTFALAHACAGVGAEIAKVGKRHTYNAPLPAQALTGCESDSSGLSDPLPSRIPFSKLRKAALFEMALAAGIPEAELGVMTVPALRARLRPKPERKRPTNAVSTASQTSAQVSDPCPLCTCAMVARRNRQTCQEFWGCSLYPDCKGCLPMVAGK